jgi:hypothetical protein
MLIDIDVDGYELGRVPCLLLILFIFSTFFTFCAWAALASSSS